MADWKSTRRGILKSGAAVVACSAFPAPMILAQTKHTARMAYVMAQGGAADRASNDVVRMVKERSGGALEIQLFPAGQLGGERDMVESVQLGAIEIGFFGSYLIANVAPEWGLVLEVPYLIKSQEQFRSIVDGPLAQPMYDTILSRKGIRHVAWCNRGPRHLTSKRPVSTPDDTQGLKLRVPEVETYVVGWRMLGATVIPMAFPEVFLALRQGIIDAQENPLEFIYISSFYEVQKYVNLTAHNRSGYEYTVSDRWYQGLPEELQTILVDSLIEGAKLEDKYQAEDEEGLAVTLKDKGMTFNEVDLDAFREALEPLPEHFAGRWDNEFYRKVAMAG
jgi:tripartite ATP-independent transporter DctP family solute receptor